MTQIHEFDHLIA